MEPRGHELISRYKANYGIPEDYIVTEEMILRHWQLEKRLRTELLNSTLDNRWEVFERCHSGLYGELDWLAQLEYADRGGPASVVYANWLDVIGPSPMRIYEIGSGNGELVYRLAAHGFWCTATEITQEQGERWVPQHPNLSWDVSDGIHLDRFEPTDFYDVVISNSVIEHVHPDDLLDHFLGGLLHSFKRGTIYLLYAPRKPRSGRCFQNIQARDAAGDAPERIHLQ